MNFKGTIEIDIDDSVKGEFIEAHDLNEDDFNNPKKIKGAILNEIYSWLECMNIGVDVNLISPGSTDYTNIHNLILKNKESPSWSRHREINEFFIFLDKEIMDNNPDLDGPLWCFVDVRNGHTEFFETEKEADNFLYRYYLENEDPITYQE